MLSSSSLLLYPPSFLPEDKGHTTGKAREGQEEVPPTKEGDLITKVPLLAATDGTLNTDVRYDDISTTRSVLGTLYQERLNQRMSGRQERRVNLAEVDLGPVEHFGAVCSAYQALKIQVCMCVHKICRYVNTGMYGHNDRG